MAGERMTKEQAEVLAQFLHMVRPGWDVAGIVAALGKARDMGTALDLGIAAMVAAADTSNRTPAVVAMQGKHWAHPALPRKSSANTTPPRNRTCGICYLPEDRCRTRWAHDHEFESLVDAARRATRRPALPPVVGGRPVRDVELP